MLHRLARATLPIYALLLIAGGVKGYQEGSEESLYAGAGSGVVTLLAAALTFKKPRAGMALGATVGVLLTGVMGWRWEKSGRIMPAGLLAITSALAATLEAAAALQPES